MSLILTAWITVLLLVFAAVMEFGCSNLKTAAIAMIWPRRIMAVACVLLALRTVILIGDGDVARFSPFGQLCIWLMAWSRILACTYVLMAVPGSLGLRRRAEDKGLA